MALFGGMFDTVVGRLLERAGLVWLGDAIKNGIDTFSGDLASLVGDVSHLASRINVSSIDRVAANPPVGNFAQNNSKRNNAATLTLDRTRELSTRLDTRRGDASGSSNKASQGINEVTATVELKQAFSARLEAIQRGHSRA